MTMGNSLALADAQLLVQLIESEPRAGGTRQSGFAHFGFAIIDEVVSFGFVGYLELIASFGDSLQAENLYGSCGAGAFSPVPLSSYSARTLPKTAPTDENVAGMQSSVLYQARWRPGRGRDPREIRALCRWRAPADWLSARADRQRAKSFPEAYRYLFFWRGGNFDHYGVAAPFLGHQTAIGELALDAFGLRHRAYRSC